MQSQPKILIAPSAYKGSLTPSQVGKAVSDGLQEIIPEAQIKLMPLADGGDGTIESIHSCLGGEIKQARVSGPVGEPQTASWLVLNDLTVIELAKCCGLAMIENNLLQPLAAHTYGLGEVILQSLTNSCTKIIIGLGGSASTDGGTGSLRALGIKFLDHNGNPLPLGGGFLNNLASIDASQLDKRVGQKQIEILTDVDSPLVGPTGAAYVFGPQKGANQDQVRYLDAGLSKLADVIKDLKGHDLRNSPGSGAAGGTAFGLVSLLAANLLPGFKRIAQLIGLKKHIEESDLVITAEGRLDHQSLAGKATGELARMCHNLGKPLWVLPASAQENICWQDFGIAGVFPASNGNRLATGQDISLAAQKILAAAKFI